MTTSLNTETTCNEVSEEPEVIELLDDSDDIKDEIIQRSPLDHTDTTQNNYINCIQLDDCDDGGFVKSDIDLKSISNSVPNDNSAVLEEFRSFQSFDNLMDTEIAANQQLNESDSEVINLLKKTDDSENVNNQINIQTNLEKTNIDNLNFQQTDNQLNSSFNDSFTSINDRVLHLESKLEINTETSQQIDMELNESSEKLDQACDKVSLSLPNENPQLGINIIKIPGKKVPDCKYRTITLKILPPTQSSNQITSTIDPNTVINPTIKREQVVSPIKISTVPVKNLQIKTINSTTRPTIQTINPIQRVNIKNENQLDKSEIKNQTKNEDQIIPAPIIKSIKRPIDEVDKAILKINKKLCVAEKCSNNAINSPDWNLEYCSSKCLIKNCTDIFKRYLDRKRKERENRERIVA